MALICIGVNNHTQMLLAQGHGWGDKFLQRLATSVHEEPLSSMLQAYEVRAFQFTDLSLVLVLKGVTPAELERVKTQWVASKVYGRDSLHSQASELGSYWVQGLGLDGGDRLMAALDTITPADVQRVATRYFSDDQLTTGVLVPAQP